MTVQAIPDDGMEETSSNLVNTTTKSKLQNILLKIPQLTISEINYLKTNFPAPSLQKLWITMKGINLYACMKVVGLDTALDFAQYMSSFLNARLDASPKKEYEMDNNVEKK